MPYQRPTVPIGLRLNKVQIQQAITADDGLGGQTIVRWKTVGEPWAKVEALDERIHEHVEGLQQTAKLAYHITMPYRDGMTPDLRMIVNDTTMQIHSAVDDNGLRERLVVYVSQVDRQ
jgi:SPP1 family predicted phage head-tail adaptor